MTYTKEEWVMAMSNGGGCHERGDLLQISDIKGGQIYTKEVWKKYGLSGWLTETCIRKLLPEELCLLNPTYDIY